VARLWTGWIGLQFLAQQGFFLLSKMLIQAVGPTHSPVGYREVKEPGCEFDHLVQRVKMSGAILLLSLYAFLVWRGRTLPLPLALCLRSCKLYVCIIVTPCFDVSAERCLCHKTALHLCAVCSVGTFSSKNLCRFFVFPIYCCRKSELNSKFELWWKLSVWSTRNFRSAMFIG
jgi:hypothetical protein